MVSEKRFDMKKLEALADALRQRLEEDHEDHKKEETT